MSVEKLLAWDEESTNPMGAFLSEQIKDCNSIDILTGYFFFDGLKEIQQALLNNSAIKLRILIGMDAGIDTRDLVHLVYEREERVAPQDAAEDYLTKLKDILGHWGQVTEAQVQLWKQYAAMIDVGRLEIRKTKQPNHAKIYIFHHQDDTVSYTGGSSNFSHSGLSGRNEFNIHVCTDSTTKTVAGIFQELWQEAVPIVDFTTHQETSEKVAKALLEDSPGTPIAPFDAYMKLMWEYLKLNHSDEKLENRIREIIREVGFDEFKYQIDAVSRAKKILDSNGGVIIADVVGLGKSVIASLLAKLSDGPGLVLAPPSLLNGAKGWNSYLEKFKLTSWKAFSAHNTDLLNQPEVKNAWTVIIDEAHNLRNENTNLFQNLLKLLTGKRIICLSATPYNNRPEDLLALIKMFSSPQIAGVSKAEFTGKIDKIAKQHSDLIEQRRGLVGEALGQNSQELKDLAKNLRSLIYPLTIRRNRIDLLSSEEYRNEVGNRIPEIIPPINCMAELTDEQGQFYDAILTKYFAGENPAFKGAMYHPQTYITCTDQQAQRQTNLYSMICRFMVSRWESSPVAFCKTLENIYNSLDTALKILKKHGIFFRGIDDYGGDESDSDWSGAVPLTDEYTDLIEQIKRARKTLPVYVTQAAGEQVKKDLQSNRGIFTMSDKQLTLFKADLREDLTVLKEIQKKFIDCELGKLDPQGKLLPIPKKDGKLQALKTLVEEVIKGGIGEDEQEQDNPRKIIVFSYYADTAKYVHDYLAQKFHDKLLYADGNTMTKEHKQEIERHFMSLKPGDKDFDKSMAKTQEKMVLVCTDVLSEGINLNQAGVVVNYDICYNPVRVIQRRGRINRIGQKVFERLYSVNFFPTAQGEDINRVGDISVRKMKMIHSILGEDACVLSDEEEPEAFLKKITDTDQIEQEMVSDETRIADLFQKGLNAKCGTDENARSGYKAYLDTIGLGHWTKIPDTSSQLNQLYIFKQNTAAFFVTRLPDIDNEENQAEQVSCFEAFNAITCSPESNVKPTFNANDSDPFWRAYHRFITGNAFIGQIPRLSRKQNAALGVIPTLHSGIQNKVGKMVRADHSFAEKLLSCEGNQEDILKLLKETEEQKRKLTADNSVEVMFVGITMGEQQ